jgi:hypothetical protein
LEFLLVEDAAASDVDSLKSAWAFLPTVEDGYDLKPIAAHPEGIAYGVPRTTRSRVPATLPGRQRFGRSARRSTASIRAVATIPDRTT